MAFPAPPRLITPELNVPRVDVADTGPVEQGVVRRAEPLFARFSGMNGEVVTKAFIDAVMSTARRQEDGLEESDPGGELVVNADV